MTDTVAATMPSLDRTVHRWTAAAAIVGGASVMIGVALPWLSTLAGLHTLTGMDGLNGRVLAAGGALAVALGAANLRPVPPSVRWVTGLLGFGLLALSSWLLLALLISYRTIAADPFALARLGPGLFVATAGAALVFSPLLAGPDDHAASDGVTRQRPSMLLLLAAAGSLLAAVLHLAVSGEHLADGTATAVAFIALGLAQALTAALIVLRPTRPVLRAATVLSTAAIVAWALTEAGLLDFLHATSHHGHIALATVAAEAVVALTCLRRLTHSR